MICTSSKTNVLTTVKKFQDLRPKKSSSSKISFLVQCAVKKVQLSDIYSEYFSVSESQRQIIYSRVSETVPFSLVAGI